MNFYTPYVSGKYWENKLPLLGAEFYQNSADQFQAFPDASVRIIFPRGIAVK